GRARGRGAGAARGQCGWTRSHTCVVPPGGSSHGGGRSWRASASPGRTHASMTRASPPSPRWCARPPGRSAPGSGRHATYLNGGLMTTIAFLGLGRMGTLMAGRVRWAGHDLIVWTRPPERTRPRVAEGARAAGTPAEAAREAEIVITMLADPAALEAVMAGPDGIAGAISPAACLVEMSTVGPKAALAARDRLPDGTGFVDAPVMGSVGPARSGELTVLAGGDVDRVEKVLAIFGTVVRCGPAGSGAARKIVLISAALAGVTLTGELLALAEALGVP